MIQVITTLALAGSLITANMQNPKLPEVSTEQAFKQNDGKKIILIGRYTPMMLPKSKRPGSPMVRSRRVSIDLGQFEVALDRNTAGIRDSAEVSKFSGKKVRVTGTATKMTTLWGNGEEQSIVMPAMLGIKKIELAE